MVSGFGFRVSSFWFRVRVSGFGFQVSGSGFRVLGSGFRVSGLPPSAASHHSPPEFRHQSTAGSLPGFRVSDSVSGFGIWISGIYLPALLVTTVHPSFDTRAQLVHSPGPSSTSSRNTPHL